MLKKYKILVLMTLLSFAGIVGIISLWLYDNYLNKREILMSEVERSLFNSIQVYYESNMDNLNHRRQEYFSKERATFVKELKSVYPSVEESVVDSIWERLSQERIKRYEKRRQNEDEKKEPSWLMPSFMLQNIEFGAKTVDSIEFLLGRSLTSKGISIDATIEMNILKEKPKFGHRKRFFLQSDGSMATRPILVNPEKNEYLTATFDQPIFLILSRMFFQVIISLVLVLALIGTFWYLMFTINKQNKLALLRKSFVNNMTHELKTPVATVMAAVEAVQRYGAKDDKEKMKKYLDISHNELNHLAAMIEQVLHFDVDEEKGLMFNKRNVNVLDVIQTSVESARLSAKKVVDVEIHSIDDVEMMDVDESHIRNVFLNLLDNAIKYSGESVRVDVDVISAGRNVEIIVKDNGLGIDTIYQKDIFDMFFRVPSGHLHPVKGFGMGLAYVKQVVTQHGGKIVVESELGKGTKFIITLPKKGV